MAAGDVLSVNIRDATTLNGVICDGWVADVLFSGKSIGGTADASKVEFDVVGPGFDLTGSPITRSARTIAGSIALRKPVPPQWVTATLYAAGDRVTNNNRFYSTAAGGVSGITPPTHSSGSSSDGTVTWTYLGSASDSSPVFQYQQATSSSDALISYALQQRIFAGETISAIRLLSGAYSQSGNSNAKSDLTNVTNNSTYAHHRPHIAWVMPPWQITGNTVHVELAVAHAFGEAGRMVACVTFIVRDASSGVVSATSTVMTQSTILTAGNPVPVFAADINIAALADGLCTVEAEVYPFRGDVTYKTAGSASSTVFVGFGTSTPSSTTTMHYNPPKKIPFRKDAAGTFGQLYAYVDPVNGVNATGVASTNPATASASPFLSISYACYGLQIQSNTTFSRANLANHVCRCKAGSYDGFSTAGATNQYTLTRGDVWLTIERDPNAAGSVIFNGSSTANFKRPPTRTKFSGITFQGNATTEAVVDAQTDGVTAWVGGTGFANELWFDSCATIGNTGTNSPIIRSGMLIIPNSTVTLGGPAFGSSTGANRTCLVLFGGCTIGNNGGTVRAVNGLGNKFSGNATIGETTTTNLDGLLDAPVWLANTFMGQTVQPKFPTGTTRTFASGMAWCLNFHEVLNGSPNKGMELSADGVTTALSNVVYVLNGIAGEGMNILYNENGTSGPVKNGVMLYNAWTDLNIKGDWYGSSPEVAHAERVGNFAFRHHVDCMHNVVYAATVSTPRPNNLAGECIGKGSVFSGLANFTSDASFTGTNAGNGNYIPLAGSAVLNMIPAGMAPLPFDLLGRAINNSGAGAAGAFQPLSAGLGIDYKTEGDDP